MQYRDPCHRRSASGNRPVTITESPSTLPTPAPRRLRPRLWWLVLLWPALVLFQISQSTWEGMDVYQGFHGLDLHARNVAAQEWSLDQTASGDSHYWVEGLSPATP